MSLDNSKGGMPTKFKDAIVYGDFNSPETQSLLDQQFDVLVGLKARQRGGTWRRWSPTLFNLLDIKLSRHSASEEKDGHALVFAKSSETGSSHIIPETGEVLPLCGRTREDIQAVTFAAFDIDDGDPLEEAIERLQMLGYFAILYTTHSHGRKRSEYREEKIDKYRILFPLQQPYELAINDPREHEKQCQDWRQRLVDFAAYELNLVIDETGCDVNRLFYTPRHVPDDNNWYIGVFDGRALRVEDMPLLNARKLPSFRRGRHSRADLQRTNNFERPILSDGFDLIDWYRDWGPWFQIRELFDWLQWDIGSMDPRRNQARILCPSDHAHSAQDDVFGCWIKDGDGGTPFVIYCHHNACREIGTLDQLVELERFVALPDHVATLSELLCDQMLYSSYLNESDGSWPAIGHYLRWDPREDAKEVDQ